METNQLGLSDQLLYSTVRIECFLQNGQISTGTGFIFRFVDDGEVHIPAIVTNKHVVEGSVRGTFILTQSDSDGNPINTEHVRIHFQEYQSTWIPHPDPNVDLCILPFAEAVQVFQQQGKKLFYMSLNKCLIPDELESSKFRAIEEVTMIGYPNGLWDQTNNLPIIRRGITATNPNINYNGKEELLIDAACFPGSSGSPVMIYDEGGFANRDGFFAGSRVYLLGILYAGPQFIATGEIIMMNIPSNPISVSQIPMNLGIVIKSQKLLEFDKVLTEKFNIQR